MLDLKTSVTLSSSHSTSLNPPGESCSMSLCHIAVFLCHPPKLVVSPPTWNYTSLSVCQNTEVPMDKYRSSCMLLNYRQLIFCACISICKCFSLQSQVYKSYSNCAGAWTWARSCPRGLHQAGAIPPLTSSCCIPGKWGRTAACLWGM